MQPNQQPPTSLSSSHVLDIEVFQASQPSQVPLFQLARLQPVLRIRDILVRPTNGSGSGSCYFCQSPSRWLLNIIFSLSFFCLLLFMLPFTSFFKNKKSQRSHQTVGIKVFLDIFA
jgi:hypothetical protein